MDTLDLTPFLCVSICSAFVILAGDSLIIQVLQSNLGYPDNFVLRILYCVRISEFVQITEVVAKISRNRLV